jgi:hypothetical protein
VPGDARLGSLKDLDGYFPFKPSGGVEEWDARARWLRRQVLVSQGLWPPPPRTPLQAVIHGLVDCGDHTVERVYFQSMPGLYVTGSLYRPRGRQGPFPAVLSAHGHWPEGRFHDAGVAGVRRELAQGAERFEEGGRSPLQARCVQLARMGCVVFHYDMLGYADSVQIPHGLAHGFAKQRPEMNTGEGWGLFSPAAESHLQGVMGLQTWNSIRALDFLLSLEEVDASRVGVTGASGGGTQTFILCAIDDRPTVAFPAVMVSTAMQGGCTCENACGLRVGAGNVDFAALFAPRPLGLTAADDWTRQMPTKGFPELRRHYAMMGAPEAVMLRPLLHYGHNYNHVSRVAMYGWFNRHLGLGGEEPVLERDYRRLTREELTVWGAGHPVPEGGPEFERRLLRWWHEETQGALRASLESEAEFMRVVGGGVAAVVGRGMPSRGEVESAKVRSESAVGHERIGFLVHYIPGGERIPVVALRPEGADGRRLIWLALEGKAGLFGAGGEVRPEVGRLLGDGVTVVGVDVYMQGEFMVDGRSVARTRRVKNPREAAAYTFGFNPALPAQRAHDALTVAAWLAGEVPELGGGLRVRVGVFGMGEAALWGVAARAVAPEVLGVGVFDTEGFRFGSVQDLHDVRFLPGGARYFDVPGMLAVGSVGPTWLAGEGLEVEGLSEVLRATRERGWCRLALGRGGEGREGDGVRWLLEAWR